MDSFTSIFFQFTITFKFQCSIPYRFIPSQNKVKINIMNVQQQENESDCGAFAIAFAKCLLEGKDPSEYDFVNPRKHLAQYLH